MPFGQDVKVSIHETNFIECELCSIAYNYLF